MRWFGIININIISPDRTLKNAREFRMLFIAFKLMRRGDAADSYTNKEYPLEKFSFKGCLKKVGIFSKSTPFFYFPTRKKIFNEITFNQTKPSSDKIPFYFYCLFFSTITKNLAKRKFIEVKYNSARFYPGLVKYLQFLALKFSPSMVQTKALVKIFPPKKFDYKIINHHNPQ